MYFNNGFNTTYEELITFYPAFYRDVLEMQAILEAEGELADNAIAEINRVIENSFIATADEEMIARLEAFLGLSTDTTKPLEERRQNVSICFFGFGKLTASKLKETFDSLTGAKCSISFSPADASNNNRLDVLIPNPKKDFDPEIVLVLLKRRLPTHLWYKVTTRRDTKNTVFIGFVLRVTKSVEISCNTTTIEPATFLTDEEDYILTTGDGAWLSL